MKEFSGKLPEQEWRESSSKAQAIGMGKKREEIKTNLRNYIREVGQPELWEALFYCVGYYGSLESVHLIAIRDMIQTGEIIE